MRRSLAGLAVVLVTLLGAGPAAAVDGTVTPSPTSAPTASTPAPEPASPSPQPTDGIRELPTQDEGADVYSVVTILLFFVIAVGIFVFIIRAGMRSADRED